MKSRTIEILFGVLLAVLTVWVVGFSPMSLKRIYSHPMRETTFWVPFGTGRPALELGWLMPLAVIFFCMLMPIHTSLFLSKKYREPDLTKTFENLRAASIMYAIGVVFLYLMSIHGS